MPDEQTTMDYSTLISTMSRLSADNAWIKDNIKETYQVVKDLQGTMVSHMQEMREHYATSERVAKLEAAVATRADQQAITKLETDIDKRADKEAVIGLEKRISKSADKESVVNLEKRVSKLTWTAVTGTIAFVSALLIEVVRWALAGHP